MKKLKYVAFAILAFGMIIAGLSDQVNAAKNDTLIIGLLAEPVTFDPPQIRDLNTSRVVRNIFEGLTGFNLGTYELAPGLAISWDISNDGMVYTFHLRKGVKFHDGSPFNAEAVKYSMERQMLPDHPAHKTGKYPYAKNYLGFIDKIDAVDEFTVTFTLKKPFAPFLQYMTHQSVRISSPASFEKYGQEVTQHPVGTGPYRLKEWQPGVKCVLEANEDWWGGAPKIKRLIYVPIIEAQARLSAIKTGEVDFTYDVPTDSLEDLRRDSNVKVLEGLSAHVWYVILNVKLSDPPFNHKLVRQAMNYAIDKQAITRDILKNTGVGAFSPLSPVYGDYVNKDVDRYPYDPDKAKALLKQAGYPNGFECIFMVPESGSGMQSPVEMGTLIQANLAAVGIKAKIETLEWGTYLSKYVKSPQMAEMSWNSTVGDPDYVLYRLFHSDSHPPAFNAGWYQNDTVDKLLREAQTNPDESVRMKNYLKAQAIIMEDAPWIIIDHGYQIAVHTSRLQDFVLSPNFEFRFEKSWLK